MKKVLLISLGKSFGGIEKYQEEIKNNISKEYSVDILTPKDLDINRIGLINKIKYHHRLSKFLKENKYDIVHINSSVYLSSKEIAKLCKKRKVSQVIAHSHSIPKYNLIRKLIMKLTCFRYVKNVDTFLSTSEEPIKSLLTKKYRHKAIIIENGIDINKFKFNEKARKELRNKYDLNKKIVYGTVGRFETVKNHLYLIDLFYEIQKKQDNAYLVLVGNGSLKNKYIDRITELNINDKVLILDYQENIYNMFDYFIMPSISEGFGISLLEAETNGLICFSSNNVSEALKANAHIFNLDDNKQELVSRIIKERESDRTNAYKDIKLDINTMIKKIEKVYSNNIELEVLLSIMNLNKKELNKMNIFSKCTIINQCNKESFEEYNNYLIYSNKDRGLSNSRNLGLTKVSNDIIVLCDDDVIYNKDYEKIILDEFKNNKDGDIILFNIDSPNRKIKMNKRNKRLHFYNIQRYSSSRIAFRRNSIKNIKFNTLFGSGSKYESGEDSLFLVNCLSNKLKIYSSTKNIGVVNHNKSNWFNGYNKKYFFDKGAVFTAINKRFRKLLMIQYLLRHKEVLKDIKFRKAYKYMKEGSSDFLSTIKRG